MMDRHVNTTITRHEKLPPKTAGRTDKANLDQAIGHELSMAPVYALGSVSQVALLDGSVAGEGSCRPAAGLKYGVAS